MSTKTATRPSTKKVAVSLKPKTKAFGTLDIKNARIVFDDSTYAGKFVVRISDRQLNGLKEVENRVSDNGEYSNPSWSTNDFGNSLKVTSDIPMERNATYDLSLKMSEWVMGCKSGISYRIISATRVDNLPDEPRPALKSLGVCLL